MISQTSLQANEPLEAKWYRLLGKKSLETQKNDARILHHFLPSNDTMLLAGSMHLNSARVSFQVFREKKNIGEFTVASQVIQKFTRATLKKIVENIPGKIFKKNDFRVHYQPKVLKINSCKAFTKHLRNVSIISPDILEILKKDSLRIRNQGVTKAEIIMNSQNLQIIYFEDPVEMIFFQKHYPQKTISLIDVDCSEISMHCLQLLENYPMKNLTLRNFDSTLNDEIFEIVQKLQIADVLEIEGGEFFESSFAAPVIFSTLWLKNAILHKEFFTDLHKFNLINIVLENCECSISEETVEELFARSDLQVFCHKPKGEDPLRYQRTDS